MTFEAPIFIPSIKKRYDVVSVIIYSFAGIVFLGSIIRPFEEWNTILFIYTGIFLVFMFTNLIRYEPLNGIINGTIKISEGGIEIDDKIVNLNDIKQIDIQFGRYEGEGRYYGDRKYGGGYGVYAPNLSLGVKNFIQITTNTGEEIKVWFKLTDNEYAQQLRELVKWFTVKGKIPLLHTISLLQLPYKEVQELKTAMATSEN